MAQQVAEKFSIACPQCAKAVTVSTAHVGKKGRCPACQTIFTISLPQSHSSTDTRSPDLTLADGLNPGDLVPAGMQSSSIWAEAGPLSPAKPASHDDPLDEPQLRAEEPTASMANHYLQRAKSDKGTMEQLEDADPQYRFWTSYGAMICGASMVGFGIMAILFSLLFFISAKLIAGMVMLIIAGCGAFLQGLNYAYYYHWKKQTGR